MALDGGLIKEGNDCSQWFLSLHSVRQGKNHCSQGVKLDAFLSIAFLIKLLTQVIALLIMAPVELGSLLSFLSSARAASISHTEKRTQF